MADDYVHKHRQRTPRKRNLIAKEVRENDLYAPKVISPKEKDLPTVKELLREYEEDNDKDSI